MNILLLIPPASLGSSYGGLKEFSNPQPSIGLAYIASVLRHNGFTVSVLDAYVKQLSITEIMDQIKLRGTDVIGISLLTTSVDVVTELVKNIRQKEPGVKIAFGNIHASLFCENILEENLADFVVHREGEHSFLELVQTLDSGADLQKV
jgi:radical SAM superfamily enzyme YgiQ (UPF0313 family)